MIIPQRRDLTLYEFLMTYVLEATTPDPWTTTELRASSQGDLGSRMTRPGMQSYDELYAQIARHRDRTMVVLTRTGTQTVTRCGTCKREPIQPCLALRRLAQPYADHPAFNPAWGLRPDEDRRDR